jgi:hypothetical protein
MAMNHGLSREELRIKNTRAIWGTMHAVRLDVDTSDPAAVGLVGVVAEALVDVGTKGGEDMVVMTVDGVEGMAVVEGEVRMVWKEVDTVCEQRFVTRTMH